jgi:predicted small lipoprotein YifL
MQTVKAILVVLIYVALLCACGLRGPLYLPDESPAPKPAVEQGSNPDTGGTEKVKDAVDDTTEQTVSD